MNEVVTIVIVHIPRQQGWSLLNVGQGRRMGRGLDHFRTEVRG